MSHHRPETAITVSVNTRDTEQNILDPIMDEQSPCHRVTSSSKVTNGRAARVGLRGSRSTHHTPQERLEARIISKGDGCWEVSGHRLHNGSVQVTDANGKQVPAHRLAWELANGPIPAGYVLAHACDNPPCIRLDHLVLTTQTENVHDSIRKGRFHAFGVQKLNQHQVLAIREASAAGEHQWMIAARFGIARSTVSGIVNHKSWAHLTKPVDGPQPAFILERVPFVHLPICGEAR